VVVHHAAEALQVVVAEEAVPEGLPLLQQGQAVPGSGHHSGDRHSEHGAQAAHQAGQIALQPAEAQQGEAQQHHRHRPLGQHGQPQHHPAGPPAAAAGGIAAPAQQQADRQAAAEQGVADGDATPDQHEGGKGEGQGGAEGGEAWTAAGLGPAQQGVHQALHHGHRRQGRGQACRPGAQGVPAGLAGQAVEQAHRPVHQRRLVVARQAVHPGNQPVAGLGHRPGRGCEQGRRLIHQARAAQLPHEQQQAQAQAGKPQAPAGETVSRSSRGGGGGLHRRLNGQGALQPLNRATTATANPIHGGSSSRTPPPATAPAWRRRPLPNSGAPPIGGRTGGAHPGRAARPSAERPGRRPGRGHR